MKGKEIINAEITSTMLGIEGHGILSCFLYLKYNGGGGGFGGYALDEWDKELEKRVDKKGLTGQYIQEIMEVVGVEKWEDIKGKYIRIDTEGWGGTVLGIGNLLEDKWFYPADFFEKLKTEEE